MLSAAGLLCRDVAKRFYIMLPSLLLDPFDLVEKLTPWDITPPGKLGGVFLPWALFGIGLFLTVALAYRDALEGRHPSAEVKSKAGILQAEEISVDWYTVSLAWILLAISDYLSRTGIESRQWPHVSVATRSMTPSSWMESLSRLELHELAKKETVREPGVRSTYFLWTLSPVGKQVVLELEQRKSRLPEPVIIGSERDRDRQWWSRLRKSKGQK